MAKIAERAVQYGYLFGFIGLTMAAVYCVLTAIQGDYGVLRRVELNQEERHLQIIQMRLADKLAGLENKAKRLSDNYVDLDIKLSSLTNCNCYQRSFSC